MSTPITPTSRVRTRPVSAASFLSAFDLGDRAKIFDDPDLVGFAFLRGTVVTYFTHVKLESDGNVSGIIGDISSTTFEIVSITRDALLMDVFRFIDYRSVAPYKQQVHVGSMLDMDTLSIVALGGEASDADLVTFMRQERQEFYPPVFADDFACVVGMPRAFPIFQGDPSFQTACPIPSADVRDLWYFIQLHSRPVLEEFVTLPGFTWMALWEFPGSDCPGTVQLNLKFFAYESMDPVYQNVYHRVTYRMNLIATRDRAKRAPTLLLGSPSSKRITHLPPVMVPVNVSTQPSVILPTTSVTATPTIALTEVYTHLALFYCVLEVTDNVVTKVTPPTFNAHFQLGLEKATDKKSLFKYVQRNFMSLKKEFSHSKHHLCNYVDYNSFKPTLPLFNLFAEANIMTKPFQSFVEVKELAAVVSLASFAAPMKSNPQYSKYISVSETNELDYVNEQSKEKSEAVQTKLYPFTYFDRSFDDVMTAVAHFLAFSHSIVHMTWNEDDIHNPTIVRMMLQLVQVVKNMELKTVFVKAAMDRTHGYPWIFHSLFLSFQGLFQQAALLLMSPVATMAVQSTSFDQIPLDEFTSFLSAFTYAYKELNTMSRVLSICADSFKACPDSFYTVGSGIRGFRQERPSGVGEFDKFDRNNPVSSDKEGDTKGWIKLLDKTKRPYDFRPQSLSEMICLYTAFEGYRCKYPTCTYKHCSSLQSLSANDQAVIKSYVDAHATVFALVQTGGQKRAGGVSTNKRVLLAQA